MLSEISKGRMVEPPSEISRPGDLLPYTLREITQRYALLSGKCMHHKLRSPALQYSIASSAASQEGKNQSFIEGIGEKTMMLLKGT
jgi:hypothetical protein